MVRRWLARRWLFLLATFRLSGAAVCAAARLGYDRHDYPDSVEGYPDHFVPLTCKRCNRLFYI